MAAILIFSVANGFFRNSIPMCNSMQTFMLVSPNARFSSNIDLICPASNCAHLEIVKNLQNAVKLIFKTFTLKPDVRSSNKTFLSQNGLIKFF